MFVVDTTAIAVPGLGERWGIQLHWDFQSVFHNYKWSNPTLAANFRDPASAGKITVDQHTASIGAQTLMNPTW